jgi:hypothetical protein
MDMFCSGDEAASLVRARPGAMGAIFQYRR